MSSTMTFESTGVDLSAAWSRTAVPCGSMGRGRLSGKVTVSTGSGGVLSVRVSTQKPPDYLRRVTKLPSPLVGAVKATSDLASANVDADGVFDTGVFDVVGNYIWVSYAAHASGGTGTVDFNVTLSGDE